jgi:amino acid transporter
LDEKSAPDEETPKERADRELIELLNELRVVLPGVTVLLAFLLAVPFAKGWPKVTSFERDMFVVAFLSAAVSVALLTAPSSYHRLRFRHGDKAHMVRVGSRLAIAGIAAFAVALLAVVLMVMSYVLSLTAAIAASATLFVVVASLWYGLPLRSALRDSDRRAR